MEVLLLGRRVDFHARIDLEHMMQSARVITMAVRQNDEIESAQVCAERRHVSGKIIETAAGVEEDAPSAVFNERRIAPPELQTCGLADRVVEDRHSCRRFLVHTDDLTQ